MTITPETRRLAEELQEKVNTNAPLKFAALELIGLILSTPEAKAQEAGGEVDELALTRMMAIAVLQHENPINAAGKLNTFQVCQLAISPLRPYLCTPSPPAPASGDAIREAIERTDVMLRRENAKGMFSVDFIQCIGRAKAALSTTPPPNHYQCPLPYTAIIPEEHVDSCPVVEGQVQSGSVGCESETIPPLPVGQRGNLQVGIARAIAKLDASHWSCYTKHADCALSIIEQKYHLVRKG